MNNFLKLLFGIILMSVVACSTAIQDVPVQDPRLTPGSYHLPKTFTIDIIISKDNSGGSSKRITTVTYEGDTLVSATGLYDWFPSVQCKYLFDLTKHDWQYVGDVGNSSLCAQYHDTGLFVEPPLSRTVIEQQIADGLIKSDCTGPSSTCFKLIS